MVTQVMKDRIWITVIVALVSGSGFGGTAVGLLKDQDLNPNTPTKEDLKEAISNVKEELSHTEQRIKQHLLDREYVTYSSMSSYVKDEIMSAPSQWREDKQHVIDAIAMNSASIKEIVQLTHEIQLELAEMRATKRR